jgi:hypothetical protein
VKYYKSHFFHDPEIKSYLESILFYGERTKCNVLFELNELAGPHRTKYAAIANLSGLFDSSINDDDDDDNNMERATAATTTSLVFPHYNEQDDYAERFKDNYVEVERPPQQLLPPTGYLLVPAKNVIVKKRGGAGGQQKKKGEKMDEEEVWNETMTQLSEEIMSAVPAKKQFAVNNIVRSILRCKDFDISPNGSMMVKGQPRTLTPILDYAMTAARMGGPNEKGDHNFIVFTKHLLRNHMPKQYVKNKSLFSSKSAVKRNTRK